MRRIVTDDQRYAEPFPVRCLALGLAVVLAVCLPVSVRAGSSDEAEGHLSVATSPAGALVYVDGELRGESPMDVDGLQAGDHRVKLVKDGYLENSRVLSVEADRTTAVDVTLTESSDSAPGAVQVRGDPGGGGGGSMLRWVLPVAAGGAVAAFFALRDSNDPPVAAFSVSPTGSGMARQTSYTFNGSGSSDPDGDSLSYSWNFGDGSTAAGSTASHVFDASGSRTVTLTVSEGAFPISRSSV